MTVCGFDRTKGLRWVRAASHARPADYEDYSCARHSSGQERITAQARCIKTSKDMYILQCANAPKLAWLPSTFVQNGVCKTQTFAKKKTVQRVRPHCDCHISVVLMCDDVLGGTLPVDLSADTFRMPEASMLRQMHEVMSGSSATSAMDVVAVSSACGP